MKCVTRSAFLNQVKPDAAAGTEGKKFNDQTYTLDMSTT